MRVKWFSVALVLTPLIVNASEVELLPDRELLEFLGRYSEEEQTWLELAMEQEQQKLNKQKRNTAAVGDSEHD